MSSKKYTINLLAWRRKGLCFRQAIMHDIAVVPNFAIDGVWINYLLDFGERFSETISVCSVDEKGHLSEIIGHSTSLCNQCCDSSHSMAMI